MKSFLMLIGLLTAFSADAQEIPEKKRAGHKFSVGVSTGIGTSYTDKVFLLNVPASGIIEYKIADTYFIRFAPMYTWLIRWNEHYLTLPVHIRKDLGEKFGLFTGPALTFDIGYFKDLGVSAGVYYHLGKRSSIVLSAFTFTLYDYHIDYLFVPVALTYRYMFLKYE